MTDFESTKFTLEKLLSPLFSVVLTHFQRFVQTCSSQIHAAKPHNCWVSSKLSSLSSWQSLLGRNKTGWLRGWLYAHKTGKQMSYTYVHAHRQCSNWGHMHSPPQVWMWGQFIALDLWWYLKPPCHWWYAIRKGIRKGTPLHTYSIWAHPQHPKSFYIALVVCVAFTCILYMPKTISTQDSVL